MTPNYRSKFEASVGEFLGSNAVHEPEVIRYTQPAKERKYLPDFKTNTGIYIECKGKWVVEDRLKHLFLKAQHPDKRIVLVFMNPDVKINKRSKTTYGMWATEHNLEWYDWRKGIPEELYVHENRSSNRNTRRRNRNKSKPVS